MVLYSSTLAEIPFVALTRTATGHILATSYLCTLLHGTTAVQGFRDVQTDLQIHQPQPLLLKALASMQDAILEACSAHAGSELQSISCVEWALAHCKSFQPVKLYMYRKLLYIATEGSAAVVKSVQNFTLPSWYSLR